MESIEVVVDGMFRQGRGNLAVRLMPENPQQTLPTWVAGAHIDVHLPNGQLRQYSLTGNPARRESYLICVKKEAASRGGSRFIHDKLRVGDTLTISAPRNAFKLQEAPQESVLIAGGIGITPILAMAEALEAEGKSFDLYYYTKTREQVAFASRFAGQFTHGHCAVMCSAEGHSPRKGLPATVLEPQAHKTLYLCGPAPFMAYVKASAIGAGWQPQAIVMENFKPAEKPAEAASGDKAFTVKLASSGAEIPVAADETIVEALRARDIYPPTSCEMGMCGACLTRVIAGKVEHRDTVQSESEKAGDAQYIALCCSRAKSGVLEIEL